MAEGVKRTESGVPIFESYRSMYRKPKVQGLDPLSDNPSTVAGVGEAQLRKIYKKVERKALEDIRNEVSGHLIKRLGSVPMGTTIALQDPKNLKYQPLDIGRDGLPRRVKASIAHPVFPKKTLSRTYDVKRIAPGFLPEDRGRGGKKK